MLKSLLRKIVIKKTCMHDWEIVHVAHYVDAADHILLVCKKCGKITKKKV